MKFYISKIILLAKFIFFPSRIRLKSADVSERESIRIDSKGEGLPLVISFAGLGDEFNFINMLSTFNVNVIYLRDLNHNWYVNGIPNVGGTVPEIVNFLSEKINLLKPSRVITVGVSAGGFGALLYGSLLKADRVLAFSPQTFVDRWNSIRHLDYRWLDRVVQIHQGSRINRPYLDVKPIVSNGNSVITLVYDQNHRLDGLHGSRISGPLVKHMKIEGGGHMMIRNLKESGELMKIINDQF